MRHLITPLLASVAIASILSTNPAHADLGDQLAKLLAKDGGAEDHFGSSVAINGTTAMVGASGDNENGTQSGSAYLFDISDPSHSIQLTKLMPGDGTAFDYFGGSLAIDGTTAIIGATGDDDNGNASGSAYLFDITTRNQLFKLLPDDGASGDRFGDSVAISDTIALIGVYRDDDNGNSSGSAYLFDTTTGQHLFKLLPNDGSASDYFGYSVAISGNIALVGTPQDFDNGDFSGSAYLYNTITGQQIVKLFASDGEEGDWFGISVAIKGTTAIIGAAGDDDNGTNSGSAYIFDISEPKDPIQIVKLHSDDIAEDDIFGWTVAIGGSPGKEIAIFGVVRDDDNGTFSGSAYLFDISDLSNAMQIAKLLPADGAPDDHFGKSVDISGTTAIAGAHWNDDNGEDSGSAYLFDAAATPGNCPEGAFRPRSGCHPC